MSVIKLAGFTGEAPRITPRLLSPTGAQIARDVRLEDGELGPFRRPFLEYEIPGAVAGSVKTIYRHLGEWLSWSTAVNAVPGPVAQDRLYYTGDGVPKMRVAGVVYPLAVQPPSVKLTATLVGVIGAVYATRLYVYTFVTSFGEESEPSPISNELNVSPGNTVTLSGFQAAPAGRGIVTQRIYRSQTGTSGGTTLFFLAERPASAANYSDTIATDNFAEPLPSIDWNRPPDGLKGLVAMPNGMMAGFVGKDLYFCEPYRPHAWPEKYILTTDYDIVAIACYGTTLVVGTVGNPYLVGGTAPEAMVMERMELNMPCLNGQGMVDLGYSIAYPSYDGLVVVTSGAANVMTVDLLTRNQWLELDPANLVCGQFYGRFFASYSYTDTYGELQEGTLILDQTGEAPFLIRSRHRADAMFYEITSGSLFMVFGTAIYEWDSKRAINDLFTWKSKEFVIAAPTSMGAILIELDKRDDPDELVALAAARAEAIAQNAAIYASGLMGAMNEMPINALAVNGDVLVPVPGGPEVSVNVYADGNLLASVSRAGVMQRLPGGVLARLWEIEVTSNTRVQEIQLAGTAMELRGV